MVVMLLGQSRVFFSMSRDGLLPSWAASIHPRFRTPWLSSLIVGAFVALFAALIPISVLGELVSIGTLFAFVIVCGGVLVLRYTHPEIPRPFRTPLVPLTPILGIGCCIYLMTGLPKDTWMRLLIWMAIGLLIYFVYGIRKSALRSAAPDAPKPVAPPQGE